MKTCKTCAAWGPHTYDEFDRDKATSSFCHRTAAIANSMEDLKTHHGWWCLDHVPIADEQSVLDPVMIEIINARNKLCNRSEPLTENEQEYLSALNWCLATIEEERNRDNAY